MSLVSELKILVNKTKKDAKAKWLTLSIHDGSSIVADVNGHHIVAGASMGKIAIVHAALELQKLVVDWAKRQSLTGNSNGILDASSIAKLNSEYKKIYKYGHSPLPEFKKMIEVYSGKLKLNSNAIDRLNNLNDNNGIGTLQDWIGSYNDKSLGRLAREFQINLTFSGNVIYASKPKTQWASANGIVSLFNRILNSPLKRPFLKNQCFAGASDIRRDVSYNKCGYIEETNQPRNDVYLYSMNKFRKSVMVCTCSSLYHDKSSYSDFQREVHLILQRHGYLISA